MDEQFTATLRKSPSRGGWTCVVWPESVEFFGTRRLVKRADVRRAIGKEAGDTVRVRLEERLRR